MTVFKAPLRINLEQPWRLEEAVDIGGYSFGLEVDEEPCGCDPNELRMYRGRATDHDCLPNTRAVAEQLVRAVNSHAEVFAAGKALAAYIYATTNPGAIPEQVKSAMRVLEELEAENARRTRGETR